MELQLTPEAEARILDIATDARRHIIEQVDEMLEGYPENHLFSRELARDAMLERARSQLLAKVGWGITLV